MQPNEVGDETWQQFCEFVNIQFGAAVAENALSKFKLYLSELIEWNEKFNLVSFRCAEEIIWRHFADSLAALKAINEYNNKTSGRLKIIDLGTGAGLPGIPVKIVKSDFEVTLVESIQKKCLFLENVKKKLELPDLTIINGRSENVARDKEYRQACDFTLSRAFTKLPANLELALPFLKTGAVALIYKTEKFIQDKTELNSAAKALALLGGKFQGSYSYSLPGLELKYVIAAFEKIRETPDIYPRREGVPEKKPL